MSTRKIFVVLARPLIEAQTGIAMAGQGGQPVTLEFTSKDATHGFMIRALKLDMDLKPGKTTDVTVTPQSAGTFQAICDHYCGLGHGMMKMTVVVQ
jgi:cytochrome c oxidase subunit II